MGYQFRIKGFARSPFILLNPVGTLVKGFYPPNFSSFKKTYKTCYGTVTGGTRLSLKGILYPVTVESLNLTLNASWLRMILPPFGLPDPIFTIQWAHPSAAYRLSPIPRYFTGRKSLDLSVVSQVYTDNHILYIFDIISYTFNLDTVARLLS